MILKERSKEMVGKKFLSIGLVSLIMSQAFPAYAETGMEILVGKLEEKGVLSANEARLILEETKEEMSKSIAKESADTAPDWTQRIAMKGDLRYRNQFDWHEDDNRETRWRQRVRVRLGLDGKVNNEVKAGVRVATGGDLAATGGVDPVSTNQTLTNYFEKRPVFFDQAYIAYTPSQLNNHVTVLAGIFENPFYSTELLWDTDLGFGGTAVQASVNTNQLGMAGTFPSTDLFANAGWFPLDEVGGSWEDPFLIGYQGGFKSEVFDKIYAKAGITIWDYQNIQSNNIDWSGGGNLESFEGRRNANVRQVLDGFRILDFPMELGVGDPLRFVGMDGGESPMIPYIGALANYAVNTTTGNQNHAWMLGGKIGYEKVGNKGDWQLAYNYRVLEQQAQLDVFPDSDFRGQGTGAKGHNLIYQYALAKNMTLGLEWYYTQRVQKVAADYDREVNILQLDANVKF